MIEDNGTKIQNNQRQHLSNGYSTELPSLWHDTLVSDCPTGQCYTHRSIGLSSPVTREVILGAWALVLSLFTTSNKVAFSVILEGGLDDSSDATISFPIHLDLPCGAEPDRLIQYVADILQRVNSSYSSTSGSHVTSKDTRDAARHVATLVQVCRQGIRRGNSTRDEDIKLEGSSIQASFQSSESTTNVVVSFRQDFFTDAFVEEILQQTVRASEWLLGRQETFTQHVNLDLILSWTRPFRPVLQEPLLHAGFERQCRLTPNAIAIGQSESVMTYQELDLGADLLAHYIIAPPSTDQEVGNIGIYFEKSSFAIMSMLAVLKAGGTYVPLDVAWPQQRIVEILRNAKISMVLCSQTQGACLNDCECCIVKVDEQFVYEMKQKKRRQTTRPGQQDERRVISPSTPAYMLYTSGSTGVPKGIPVSHAAISTAVQAIAEQLEISSRTRTFQYTTFTFDLNIADIWMTLHQGGRICLPTEDERFDPGHFIAQERCNYAMITPSAALTIDKASMIANIKTLALIGEPVPQHLLRELVTSGGSLKLYNVWGPTEASVMASSSRVHTLNSDLSLSLHPNDIGKAVGCSIFLVSPTDPHCLAPAFAPGEIALVGHTLANGYYDNVAKTEEAFRTDLTWTRSKAIASRVASAPGGAAAFQTVYLTGDIGRYNPSGDGSIIFMHRKDGGYVKINGYRVDPREVESRIIEGGLSRKGICVLDYRPSDQATDSGPQQVLVCFFVADDGQRKPGAGCAVCEFQTPSMRQAVKMATTRLREVAPEYMVPRLFVPLEGMPMLTSHKLDRKSLIRVLTDCSWSELVKKFGS